jgi:Putative zinc-finger
MKKCLDEGTLQGYFDGELSNAAAEQAAAHLAECRSCAEAAREVQSEMFLLSVALQPEFAVRVPTERLRGRIVDAIAELQLINSGRANSGRAHPEAQAPRSWVGWLNDLFGSSQRAFSYAAVAAVVVASAVLGVIYLKRGEVTPRTEVVKNGGPVPTASPKSSPEVSPVPLLVNSPDVAFRPAPRKFQPRRSTPQAESTAKLLPGEQGYIRTIAALDATIKSNTRPMRPGLQVEYQHNLAVVDNAIAATRAAAQKNPKDPDAAQFLNSAYQSKVDLMTQVADARLFNTQPR